MNIHEYQAKELLKRRGVPVPEGFIAWTPDEATAAAAWLPGPVYVVMAQIHQCSGELQKADDIYREALVLAEKIGEPQLILPCYDGLATIHLDRGDRARAEEYMEKARQLSERTGLDPDTLLLLPFLC